MLNFKKSCVSEENFQQLQNKHSAERGYLKKIKKIQEIMYFR